MTTATGAPPIESRPGTIAARAFGVIAIGGVALFGLVSLAFVVRGRLNADEGWYLYAGRLVWRGEIPFRDFSFTQMPLVPYVYGLFQLPEPSLYVGRLVSFAFATTAVALSVRVAWREAGRASAAAVAVLCLAFPTGIYNLTLTKTYALVAFLLAAILAALTSPGRRTFTFPVATAAATGLALTRTSGIPLACFVVAYAIWRAPDRVTRWRAAIVPAIGAIFAGTLVLLDPSAARFGLSTFHQLLWHHASTRTRIDTILTDRIPEWASHYWGYLLLTAVALLAVALSSDVRRYVREKPVYLMMTVGLILYLGVQLVAGQWAPIEYVAPVVPVVAAMATVLVFRWCFGPSGTRPAFRLAPLVVGGAVLALAVLTIFHPSARGYLVDDATPGTIAAADRVADYVSAHTDPSDEVLALWGQPQTLAADRDLVHDATFGIFSYEDLNTRHAKELHYVNQRRLVDLLESGTPAAVVLTDLDRMLFDFRGSLSHRRTDPDTIPSALARHYRKVYSDTGWGTDGPIGVDVYLRNDRTP
ncbi:MAG: hypothetical protein WD271_05270 [Acidimicrobiia bacterium]